jgi:lipopolysaccharide heptosyltransferase II
MKKLFFRLLRVFFQSAKPRPVRAENIQRILVIKLCCIGDILFTTPLLRVLQSNYPRVRITYMVSSWCGELVSRDPRVSNIIEFNAYEPVGRMEKLRRAWQAIRAVRKGQFDLAFILHRTPLAGLLAAAGNVPIRIGFDWEGRGFAHTHPVPFRPEAHEVDRDLEGLKFLGLSAESRSLDLAVPPELEQAAKDFLTQQGYKRKAGPLVALFPGGGVNPGTVMTTKRWPLEGYQEVCQELSRGFKACMLMVGNTQDAEVIDRLLAGVQLDPPAIRSEGRTSLLMLAALLKQCDLFIGGDSGPLHIADAVGIPTVSIFGPTDPNLLAPRGSHHRVVRHALACSPCYTPVTVRQKDVTICREGTMACMRGIKANEVLEAAGELLKMKGSHP